MVSFDPSDESPAMNWLLELRPIPLFSFYLVFLFLASTVLRVRQYNAVFSLAGRLRSRWPNLTSLIFTHRHIFLTWDVYRPLFVVGSLVTVNTLASQFVWPQARDFRVADLVAVWPAVPFVALTAAAMVAFDVHGTLQIGEIDQAETEKYFDQAESWLRGWKAPAVRILSLGFVNPRKIVAQEVRTALENATPWLHSTLRWFIIQTALRIAFGLALWSSYALSGWLGGLVGAGG
jgi:hypothetical protein